MTISKYITLDQVYKYSVKESRLGLIKVVDTYIVRDFYVYDIENINIIEKRSNGGNIYDFLEVARNAYILLSSSPTETYFLKSGIINKLPYVIHSVDYFSDGTLFVLSDDNQSQLVYISIDINDLSVIKEYSLSLFLTGRIHFCQPFIFSSCEGMISAFSVELNSEIWRLDLSSKGVVTDSVSGEVYKCDLQFLEVHDDLLVVNIGNGYLATYKVADGSLVWEQKMESAEPYLKISKGSIYFLYPHGLGSRFSVYDLYTGQLKYEQPLENEVIRNESFFTKPFLTDDYFMITGHYRKHIFFFNRHTAKLDFTVDLNPYTSNSFGYLNAPQLHGKYLYQLDNEGQLFVFEMQEGE